MKNIFIIIVGCLLSACVSGKIKTGDEAIARLKSGECPSKIIGDLIWDTDFRTGMNKRYGYIEKSELAEYRKVELKNCEAKVTSGDVKAVYTLARYWYSEKDGRKSVRYYKKYLDLSGDKAIRSDVALQLYYMYNRGRYGIQKNMGLANRYLVISAELGNDMAGYNYAVNLKNDERYEEALSYFISLTENDTIGCNTTMNIAEMYFKGMGVEENWYIGYYYWMEGLSRAERPNMGECTKSGLRYAVLKISLDRKKDIDELLEKLSQQELDEIQLAWEEYDTKGLSYVSAMPFKKKSILITGKKADFNKYSQSVKWKKWKPISGGNCKYRAKNKNMGSSGVYSSVSGSIWTITSGQGKTRSLGSAVAISKDEVITNCHVIVNPENIQLSKGGKNIIGVLISSDRKTDRCVIEAKDSFPQYIKHIRKSRDLRVGEDVFAIGNPQGLDASLSKGVVSQKRNDGGRSYVQTDAAISPGSSGGGLFDVSANLIGITTFKITDGENLNFAISVDEFCQK